MSGVDLIAKFPSLVVFTQNPCRNKHEISGYNDSVHMENKGKKWDY